MSPRHEPKSPTHEPQSHLGSQPGQDRERQEEEDRHHPMDHPHPHPAHRPQVKPTLPPRHDAHSHPHGDERLADTNPPGGPSSLSKKMTKNRKILIIPQAHYPPTEREFEFLKNEGA